MTGTPNKPLNPFRRQEHPTPNPLHSRWGDVAISVPTEGSWSQYNNPHRRGRKGDYGPGYVSEYAARRHHPHQHRHRQLPSDTTNNNHDNDEVSKPTTSTNSTPTTSSNRTHNPNQGRKCISTRRRPLSVTSRPTPSPAEPNETEEKEKLGQERLSADPRPDFAYKPISQDYPTEIAESQGSQLHRANTASSARFRYIPANARYRDEFGEIPARSGSKGKESCRSAGKRASTVSSTSSSASSKRLTTAMVPDAEDIYG